MPAYGAVKEAAAEFARGEKALKTGLFKWNPDYLTAVHHFETAAKGFRRGAETKHYIAALMRAAECCDKLGNYDTAASHLANAASEVSKAKTVDSSGPNAIDLYKRAAEFYKLKNDLKGASTVLDKAAKLQAKAADFDGACATMMTAINLFVGSDKLVWGTQTFRNSLNFFMQYQRYDDVLAVMDTLLPMVTELKLKSMVDRFPLYRIIVHLTRGDTVAARRTFTACLDDGDWLMTKEAAAAEDLLHAMESHNGEALDEAKKLQVLGFLEQQFARAARRLEIGVSKEGVASTITHLHVGTPATAGGAGGGAGAAEGDMGAAARLAAKKAAQDEAADQSNRNALFSVGAAPAAAPAASFKTNPEPEESSDAFGSGGGDDDNDATVGVTGGGVGGGAGSSASTSAAIGGGAGGGAGAANTVTVTAAAPEPAAAPAPKPPTTRAAASTEPAEGAADTTAAATAAAAAEPDESAGASTAAAGAEEGGAGDGAGAGAAGEAEQEEESDDLDFLM